jgi:hypothetical protein
MARLPPPLQSAHHFQQTPDITRPTANTTLHALQGSVEDKIPVFANVLPSYSD